MTEPTIVCPHCKREVKLNETLAAPFLEDAEREFEKRLAKERTAAAVAARKEALESSAAERDALEKELAAKRSKLQEAQARESNLLLRERELAERAGALQLDLQRQLAQERLKIIEATRKETREAAIAEVAALRADLERKSATIADAQAVELELRTRAQTLEDEKRALAVKMQRTLDGQRNKIREDALTEAGNAHRLKEAEYEKVIQDLKRQAEEMQRKSTQGSQQLQGEVLELDVEAALARAFASDAVEPVPKGQHGGDCLQRVIGPGGVAAGTIIWESKRTKAWSASWLAKLRDDQRAARAEVAVLVTSALPPGVAHFDRVDGVWVTDMSCAMQLASALRVGLIEAAKVRLARSGKNTKMEMLYEYLGGPQFRHRVQGMVEAFAAMKDDLEAEKRATVKQWAKREKQIERMAENTAGMYGDLQGIGGASIAEIEGLELAPALPEGDDDPSPAPPAPRRRLEAPEPDLGDTPELPFG